MIEMMTTNKEKRFWLMHRLFFVLPRFVFRIWTHCSVVSHYRVEWTVENPKTRCGQPEDPSAEDSIDDSPFTYRQIRLTQKIYPGSANTYIIRTLTYTHTQKTQARFRKGTLHIECWTLFLILQRNLQRAHFHLSFISFLFLGPFIVRFAR